MSPSTEEPIVDATPGRDAETVRHLSEAMADPLRARLLAAIAEKPGITIRRLAAWAGETDRKVRYHVEALMGDDLVEVHDEVRRRGTIERQYRVTTAVLIDSDEEHWVSAGDRRRISLEVLKLVMGDATSSVAAGRFGTREGHCETRVRGEVDDLGWEELADLFLRTTLESQEIIGRSVARRAETGEAGVEVTAALFLFEAMLWNRD